LNILQLNSEHNLYTLCIIRGVRKRNIILLTGESIMKTKTLANQNERLARVILTEMEIAFKYFQTGLNSKEEYINRMIPLTQMSKVLEKVL
jgi:hypothetical protein